MHREQLYCGCPRINPEILNLSGIIGFSPDKSIKLQGRHCSQLTTICALLRDAAARLNELLDHYMNVLTVKSLSLTFNS